MRFEIFAVVGKMISRTGAIIMILGTIQRGLSINVVGGDVTIVGGLICMLLGSVLEGIKENA